MPGIAAITESETPAASGTGRSPIRRLALISSQSFSIHNFRGPLIRAWADAGIEVFALAPDHDEASRHRIRAFGAEPIDYRLARTGLDPLADLRSIFELVRILRRLRVDASFAYFVKPVVYGSLAARAAGIRRRFAMIEGAGYAFADDAAHSLPRRLLRGAVASLYRSALAGAERVFFLNRDDLALFTSSRLVRPQQVVEIGGIGVDLDAYPQPPLPAAPVFILVARLLVEKGVREFVEAARRVRALHAHCHFVLVGGVDANPGSVALAELEAWAAEGVVEWTGQLADVRPQLARASVFVLPSYYREGVPRSIQEAMAMGRAVITTDMPGCRDTVDDGINGFLVPARDLGALVQAMLRYVAEPALADRHGAASRQLAELRFDARRSNRLVLDAMGIGTATRDGG